MSMLLHKLHPPKKQTLSEGVFLNFLMWRWLSPIPPSCCPARPARPMSRPAGPMERPFTHTGDRGFRCTFSCISRKIFFGRRAPGPCSDVKQVRRRIENSAADPFVWLRAHPGWAWREWLRCGSRSWRPPGWRRRRSPPALRRSAPPGARPGGGTTG